jgi:HEAT repeat protein
MDISPATDSPVFISYSRRDALFVDKLRAEFDKLGIKYWLDRANLRSGMPNWERTIRDALSECKSLIYVASPHAYASEVITGELAIARMNGSIIYPVWATGTVWLECVALDMSRAQYIDMRNGRFDEGLAELVRALRGERPDLAWSVSEPEPLPEGAEPRNPYKGLRAFSESDAQDYFGRENLISTLLEIIENRLDENSDRLITVVGPSGSGKSSVVMAGLLPRLRSGVIAGSEKWVIAPQVFPGGDPLLNLSFSLKAILPNKRPHEILGELSAADAEGLSRLAHEAGNGQTVVVFIDQFEELFTQVDDEEVREQFVSLLVSAALNPDRSVLVVITLRGDFYDRPMNYPQFGRLVEAGNKSVLPMTLYELYDAIVKPADQSGVQLAFEEGLVIEIAFDLIDYRDPTNRTASLAGALPLLQFALERLFLLRDNNRLTLAAYREMKGVSGAIGEHAEDVFKKLNEPARESLPRVFYRLVTIDEQGVATRKRSLRQEVTSGDLAAEQLVAALIENRLLVADAGDTIEVAHEALLRTWGRLAEWIAKTGEHVMSLQRVQLAAGEWERAGRPGRMLWDYERLEPIYEAITTLKVNSDAVLAEFIRPQTQRLKEEFITAPPHRQRTIVDRFAEIGADAADELVAVLPYVKDRDIQAAIDDTLWTMPEETVAALRGALGGNHANLRRAAAETVARLGVIAVLPALLANLQTPSLSDLKAEIDALASMADEAGAIPLLEYLRKRGQELPLKERRAIVQAFGSIAVQDDAIVSTLTSLLRDARAEIRQDAAAALGELGIAHAANSLVECARDASPAVRAAVMRSLGQVKNGHAQKTLIYAAKDENADVRANAVRALGEHKGENVLSLLTYVLRDSKPEVREAAADALAMIGHAHAIIPLSEVLRDDAISVRCAAARALTAFRGAGVANHLRRALMHDRDWQVRVVIAEALGVAGDGGSIEPLLSRLNAANEKTPVRIAAITALGKLRAQLAVSALIERLRKSNIWQVRSACAQALGAIGDKTCIEPLLTILHAKDPDAALAAALVLVTFGRRDTRVLNILQGGLKDPRSDVMRETMRAIGSLKDSTYLPALLTELSNRSLEMRREAAIAIGLLGDESVIPDLKQLLVHPFLGVRNAARRALREMNTPAAHTAFESN